MTQLSFAARPRSPRTAEEARRLLALATIYEGSKRIEAAKIGGVTFQILRDWVMNFNAQGTCGLDRPQSAGQKPRLMTEHRAALANMVDDGPIPAIHGVVRWRLVDLCQWWSRNFMCRFAADDEPRIAGPGLRKLSARPHHHAQAATRSRILKNFPTRLEEIARKKDIAMDDIEIWFADEARIG